MATIFLSAYSSRRNSRVVKRKTVSKIVSEGKKFFTSLVMVLICLGGLLYIFQINSLATKGYEVGEYEKKLLDLRGKNQELAVKLAEIRSVSNLENDSSKLATVSLSDINYILSSSSAVAMGKQARESE